MIKEAEWRKVSQCWAVIRFFEGVVAFLADACQPGDATAGCRCCLLVSPSDLTKPAQRPLGHPSAAPPGSAFKCLCYLAQSITCVKSNGCVWREDSAAESGEGGSCEVGVRDRWPGSVSLSPWQLLSNCSWQAYMHPPTCTRGAAGTHIYRVGVSPTHLQPCGRTRASLKKQNTNEQRELLRATRAP